MPSSLAATAPPAPGRPASRGARVRLVALAVLGTAFLAMVGERATRHATSLSALYTLPATPPRRDSAMLAALHADPLDQTALAEAEEAHKSARDGAIGQQPADAPGATQTAPSSQPSVRGAASDASAALAGESPPRLVERPLPKCMVGFFVHVDKTGGTSVRSLLQAQGAHGDFDTILFTQQTRTPFWDVLVQNLVARATARQSVRLLVEMHTSQSTSHMFWAEMLRDILALRVLFRRSYPHLGPEGCPVRLATFFRAPLDTVLSLHHYSIYGRSPLCMWLPTSSMQMRLFMGLPYDTSMTRTLFTREHAAAVLGVLVGACADGQKAGCTAPNGTQLAAVAGFDAVGVTEEWWPSMLRLVDVFGLQHPDVATVNVAATKGGSGSVVARSALRCSKPRRETEDFVAVRIQSSSLIAFKLQRSRPGQNVVGCPGFGCVLPARMHNWTEDVRSNILRRPLTPGRKQPGGGGAAPASVAKRPRRLGTDDAQPQGSELIVSLLRRPWVNGSCDHAEAQPAAVVDRLCRALQWDRVLHAHATRSLHAKRSPSRDARAVLMEARVAAQAGKMSDGRLSCPTCHQKRESMLDECWRKLVHYPADPGALVCRRRWFGGERGLSRPSQWEKGALLGQRAPCWRTCWRSRSAAADADASAVHCTAPCYDDGGDDADAESEAHARAPTDSRLAPSPLPATAERTALRSVLDVAPVRFYREWSTVTRPKLLDELPAPLRSHVLAPLDFSTYELGSYARIAKRGWAPFPPRASWDWEEAAP